MGKTTEERFAKSSVDQYRQLLAEMFKPSALPVERAMLDEIDKLRAIAHELADRLEEAGAVVPLELAHIRGNIDGELGAAVDVMKRRIERGCNNED